MGIRFKSFNEGMSSIRLTSDVSFCVFLLYKINYFVVVVVVVVVSCHRNRDKLRPCWPPRLVCYVTYLPSRFKIVAQKTLYFGRAAKRPVLFGSNKTVFFFQNV